MLGCDGKGVYISLHRTFLGFLQFSSDPGLVGGGPVILKEGILGCGGGYCDVRDCFFRVGNEGGFGLVGGPIVFMDSVRGF